MYDTPELMEVGSIPNVVLGCKLGDPPEEIEKVDPRQCATLLDVDD